ncbi:ParH-like protein [Streptomyces sp. NBC_00239]|uniref:ParH-like protein n=1 Tax=Streptomyces sp. NBC_00239 TaxID=2903640 RepID=UPI002E2AE462|nr:ParH-like protein [Streptomyces sp. NBC_00239]
MVTGRQRRRLWRRCRRIAATLPVRENFDADALAADLSARLGRPVELLPLSWPSSGPCGLLMSTDRADYIGYPVDTTPLHQRHIVLHEVGHLLCGHRDGSGRLAPATAATLLPNLSGELVRRVLGRTGYTDTEEQEAELFASLVLHRAARAGRPPAAAADLGSADTAARLRSLFTATPAVLPAPAPGPGPL